MNNDFKNIDEYIANSSPEVRKILERIREIIRENAPRAVEAIRYGMPTFRLDEKNLIHFAAFQKHVGLYPTPSGITSFQKELSKYKQGKGSIQFPIDKPIPYDLIKRITAFRVSETKALKKEE